MQIVARSMLFIALGMCTVLHASTMYSFAGAGFLSGTNFVVDSPMYLTYSDIAQYAPDSGHLVVNKQDKGAISHVSFFYGNQAAGITAIGISVGNPFTSYVALYSMYNIGVDGVYASTNGTLTIQSTPGVTPEPSSLILLGTGLLVTLTSVRRRIVS